MASQHTPLFFLVLLLSYCTTSLADVRLIVSTGAEGAASPHMTVIVGVTMNPPLSAGDSLALVLGNGATALSLAPRGTAVVRSLGTRIRFHQIGSSEYSIQAKVTRADGSSTVSKLFTSPHPSNKPLPQHGSRLAMKRMRGRNGRLEVLFAGDNAPNSYLKSATAQLQDGSLVISGSPYLSRNPYFRVDGTFDARGAKVTFTRGQE